MSKMFRFRRLLYIDNNATTKVTKSVRRKVNYVLKYCYGNPSSLYRVARNSAFVLEESRKQMAKTINAAPHEIYFTGSATEANNNILKAVSEFFYPEKKKIISTPIEHPSVMNTLDYLKGRDIDVEYCPVDTQGRVSLEKIEQMVDSNVFLICCILANNEIGTIQDVRGIVQIAREHHVLVMSDCVQALGKIKVDVKDLGIDYASFSAHKIHGPKGVGALFVKEGSPLSPFIHGGHQERGMRAGTEGLHNIAGFAEACRNVERKLTKAEKILSIKEQFISELRGIKGDIVVNSPEESCLPNTASVAFPGVKNSVFMAALDYHGIAVSAGSACNAQSDEPSHVLKAIGLSDEKARETIRFSLSDKTSWTDIKYVVRVARDFLEDRLPPIVMIHPKQLNENILLSENAFILDVRFWHDRKMLKGLPNSREAPFFSFKKYIHQIPKDKNIVVVCQFGSNSPIIAYQLRSKGFKNVSFLLTGLVGWKLSHPELYDKLAGKDIVELKPKALV